MTVELNEREPETLVKMLKADVSELIESIEASFRNAEFKALSDYARVLAEKSEVLDKQQKLILPNELKQDYADFKKRKNQLENQLSNFIEQEKTKELEQQDFIKQEYINHIFQEIKETPTSEIENYFQWGIAPEEKRKYCIELYDILCRVFILKTELTENERKIFRNLVKNLIDKYLTQDKKDLFKNSNYYFIYESLTD